MIKKSRAIALIMIMSVAIITQTGCSSTPDPVEDENYYLDTTCKITVYGMKGDWDEDEAQSAIDDAWDLCAKLDKTLSNTVDASDVSKINDAGGAWVTVSDDTVTLIKSGIKYAELSDGAFDITIGRLTDLWDYHSDDPEVPSQAKIDEALAHIDYHCVEVDGNKVRLTDPEAKIDLGGIAKGYIADRMAKLLVQKGVKSAIVNLGGNIVCIGKKLDGGKFKIGIEKPFSDRSEIIGNVKVINKTVVTSGIYERYFKKNGKIYHHILSTTTGYPAETDMDSVTLVTERGKSMDADAMSTICLIKGSKEGLKFIESQDGVEALFYLKDGTIKKTSGFKFEAVE